MLWDRYSWASHICLAWMTQREFTFVRFKISVASQCSQERVSCRSCCECPRQSCLQQHGQCTSVPPKSCTLCERKTPTRGSDSKEERDRNISIAAWATQSQSKFSDYHDRLHMVKMFSTFSSGAGPTSPFNCSFLSISVQKMQQLIHRTEDLGTLQQLHALARIAFKTYSIKGKNFK